jgi:hypothetical protein
VATGDPRTVSFLISSATNTVAAIPRQIAQSDTLSGTAPVTRRAVK